VEGSLQAFLVAAVAIGLAVPLLQIERQSETTGEELFIRPVPPALVDPILRLVLLPHGELFAGGLVLLFSGIFSGLSQILALAVGDPLMHVLLRLREPAKSPGDGDDPLGQHALGKIPRGNIVEDSVDHAFQLGRVIPLGEQILAEDPVLDGIACDDGFPLRCLRAGRFEGVATIRFDLTQCRHDEPPERRG
jgi:hypothetical protein